MGKCSKGEGGKCREHNDMFDGGHTDWGDEFVCDWYAWMFVHGECMVCGKNQAPVTPVARKRRRRTNA